MTCAGPALRDVTAISTRSLTVGPIVWSISFEPSLGPVVDPLLTGLDGLSSASPRLALEVSLVVSRAKPSRRELPRLPHFAREAKPTQREEFSMEHGRLIDRSQGWDAWIELGERKVTARFELVDVAAFDVPWASQLMALNVAAALRVALGMAAPHADALLFHAAALELGRAALFLGASGQGKTTMTRRLPGWRVLADDAVLVWRDAAGWWASGTPLPGKEAMPRSLTPAPLSALVFLEPHAPDLALTPVSAGEAGFSLLSRLHWFGEPTPALASLGAALAGEVRAHGLSSSLAHDVAAPLSALVRQGRA